MKSPLPDRERRHLLQFHFLPRLEYRTRLLVALGLISGGLLLQFLLVRRTFQPALWGGAVVILAGNLLLLVKGFDLNPKIRGGGEWERSTLEKFDEITRLDKQVRKWDETATDVTSVSGCFTLLLLVLAPAFVIFYLISESGPGMDGYAVIFGLDVLVLIVPHWFTGVRRKWRPVGLLQRVEALATALEALKGRDRPPCQVQPMLRVTEKDGRRTPNDARVFIRFPDGPEDFLGLQFQVAINTVQGTHYPYLYAVLVARLSFELIERNLAAVERLADGLTVEEKVEGEAEVIVLRQHTTEKSGYHTNKGAVTRIARIAWDAVVEVLSAPAAARENQ